MSENNSDPSGVPPVERVRHEVDRWIEAVRSTGERTLETLGLTGSNRPAMPPVDIIELPNEILVQIELPGVSAEQVELSLVGNMLTISADRSSLNVSSEARVHVRERAVGRYQRSIPLPVPVNGNDIRAETRNGLLTVSLGKVAPLPGRSIPVSSGDPVID